MNAPVRTVKVVNTFVFRMRNGVEETLLVRRAAGEAMAGYWGPPGGTLEKDEPINLAAARELAEETGLQLISSSEIPFEWQRPIERPEGVVVVDVTFLVVEASGLAVNAEPDVHDRLEWVPLDEIPQPLMGGVEQALAIVRPAPAETMRI